MSALRIFNAASGKEIAGNADAYVSQVTSLSFRHGRVALGGLSGVRMFDLVEAASKLQAVALPPTLPRPTSAWFSPDARTLLTVSDVGDISLIDVPKLGTASLDGTATAVDARGGFVSDGETAYVLSGSHLIVLDERGA